MMLDFERLLTGSYAAAPASHVLEGLGEGEVDLQIAGAPQTIYSEVWHVAFWQETMLDWFEGRKAPVPEHAALGSPTAAQRVRESWERLR